MPKSLTTQNIAEIGNIRFVVDDKGQLTSILVNCEINYGRFGVMEEIDLIPELTDNQKQAAQKFYDNLKSKLEKVILG